MTAKPDPIVTLRPIAQLKPNPRNTRTHPPEQIAQLKDLIRLVGFTNPILEDDEGIIAGHGRLIAVSEMWAAGETVMGPGKRAALPKGKVPAINCAGLTEAERRAYVIADNSVALNAGWDVELLRTELLDLKALDFDLALLAFDDRQLVQFMASPTAGKTDPDNIPKPPARATARLDDIWILGEHRLICGDATAKATVERLLGDVTPHLMVTDPPYGVDYDPRWRLEAGVNKAHQTRAEGKVENDNRADWTAAWALFPGAVAYVWHGGLHSETVSASLRACEFEPRAQIIWAKPSLVIGRGHYHWQHEPCWYMVKKGATGHWEGDRKQSTVWHIANMHRTQGNVDDGKTDHGTQKPVECMRRPIENNSRPGDSIYEPFSGSGTTIIAAEMTSRRCFAVELNPIYVDMAVRRWEEFTGKKATLEDDGRTFAELAASRANESEGETTDG